MYKKKRGNALIIVLAIAALSIFLLTSMSYWERIYVKEEKHLLNTVEKLELTNEDYDMLESYYIENNFNNCESEEEMINSIGMLDEITLGKKKIVYRSDLEKLIYKRDIYGGKENYFYFDIKFNNNKVRFIRDRNYGGIN